MQKLGFVLTRFRGDIVYSLGTVLTSVVAVIGNLVAARFLRPEEMGIMQTLMLIPIYCAFLQLGVFNGLNRDIAFYLGRGDSGKVQRMVNCSWATAKLVAAAGLVISVVASACFWAKGASSLYLWGMIFVLLTLVTEPFSTHLEVVYLSSKCFLPLGVKLMWQNLLTMLGSLLPAVAGAGGFVIARSVAAIARFFFRWVGVPIKAVGPGSFQETRKLAVVGMPLLITGTLYGYLGAADRSVIAFFMTPKDVGHYALAGLAVAGIQFLPLCLAALLYPRVCACYGRTGSSRELRRYFWILLGLNVAVVLPICLVAFLGVGPVTQRFLPAYVEGIPAARVACLSSVTFVYFGLTSIIAVMRRNTPFIAIIVVSLALVWLLGGYWVRHGYGIVGAVWARAVASTVLCGFTIGFTYWLTSDNRDPETPGQSDQPFFGVRTGDHEGAAGLV
jgi:O-antigen/teichoic acid export membrane protein